MNDFFKLNCDSLTNPNFLMSQQENYPEINFDYVKELRAKTNSKSLNIMAWNCGGLTRVKAEEFNVTLKDFNVDIALVAETWFTKTYYKRYFAGYK